MSLRERTGSALLWSLAQVLGQQGFRFVVSILMARLLMPAEVGVVGMLALFVAVGDSLVNSGFRRALIAKRELTPSHVSTVFLLNVATGLACAAAMFFSAPAIAAFYQAPVLEPLARWMSLSFVLTSLNFIQGTLLAREIDFRTQLLAGLAGQIPAGCLGLILASWGYGPWSLVAQALTGHLLSVVAYWYLGSFRPRWVFDALALREIWALSARFQLTRLVDTTAENSAVAVIGRAFSATDLAFYWRADQLQQLPSNSLGQVVERVFFPVFATIQGDPGRLRMAWRRSLTSCGMIVLPMMVGMGCVANELVVALMTAKWAPVAGLLRVLCVSGAVYPLYLMNMSLLSVHARESGFVWAGLMRSALVLGAVLLTYRWGIGAIVTGNVAASVLAYLVSAHVAGRWVHYGVARQLSDLAPFIALSGLMAVFVHGTRTLPLEGPWALLVAQVVVGVVVYVGSCYLLRLGPFLDILAFLRRRLSTRVG